MSDGLKFSKWQALCNHSLREFAPNSIEEARHRGFIRLQGLSGSSESRERLTLLSALHSLTVWEEYLAATPAHPQRIVGKRGQSTGTEQPKRTGAAA